MTNIKILYKEEFDTNHPESDSALAYLKNCTIKRNVEEEVFTAAYTIK